ncbi:MAG: DUF3365 domain-containing protein [Bacteroidetes bacterium]|nr:DUF3365 domain-containing protein [Bacteroidota bacterium]
MKTKLLYFIPLVFLFACNTSEKKVDEEKIKVIAKTENDYLIEGKQIAEATFKVLSTNLKNVMAEGGVENAIKFCNVNAMPLTDSLSDYYNVTIKRVSHKPRNLTNEPTALEQHIIDNYLALGTVENMQPMIARNEQQKNVFYAPIPAKGLCLSCHGIIGETLLPEHYETIKKFYPNDKAIGFKEGDFRGMWSITFKQ